MNEKKKLTRRTPRRGKEQIKQAFRDAMGMILAEEGYEALTVIKVCQVADRGKDSFYLYYHCLDDLKLDYALESDYWLRCLGGIPTEGLDQPEKRERLKTIIIATLQNQLFDYLDDPEKQELFRQSIDRRKDPIQKLISDMREAEGEKLLQHTDKLFAHTGVDFRALAATLVASNDYLPLHARYNRRRICGEDFNEKRVQESYTVLIETMVSGAFAQL